MVSFTNNLHLLLRRMGLLKLAVVAEEAEDGDSVGETAVDVEASVVMVSEVGNAEEVVS